MRTTQLRIAASYSAWCLCAWRGAAVRALLVYLPVLVLVHST